MAESSTDSKKAPPELVLRGVERVERQGQIEWDITVLLFKGKGDFLQGFVVVNGEKKQVLAHMNERKADAQTGEVKANFLKLVEGKNNGEETTWKEVGFGNAMNRRSDGKEVYYDTVLFAVGDQTLSARISKDVSPELHRQLGFEHPPVSRPKAAQEKAAPAEEPAPAPAKPRQSRHMKKAA